MSDNSTQNSVYDSLLMSIGALSKVNESLKNDKLALSNFMAYLSQHKAEISKFGKASGELCDYLNGYDFSKSYQFDAMQKKLDSLYPLRQKFAQMGEEAKKLIAFPDRYNSKRAIEVCKGLAITGMEKMSLSETKKVEELVVANTQKLIQIYGLFMKDGAILNQINATIDSEKQVLGKFRAYLAELREYVSAFPHNGVDDLSVVRNRIEVARQMNELLDRTQLVVSGIIGFADRYNKNAIVDSFSQTERDMSAKMLFSDVNMYKSRLNEIVQNVKVMIGAFENEKKELESIKLALTQKKAIVWKEDCQKLLSMVNTLLNGSPKVPFDLGQLQLSFANAKSKRTNDISDTIKAYSWLESNKKYKNVHTILITKNITLSEYHESINKLKRIKRLRFILLFIPIIGWLIMPEIKL